MHFPTVSRAALGAPGDLWDSNPEHYQGWAELRDRLAALGRVKTGEALAFELASFLLDDLIVAAGGVEASITRFRDAVSRAKAAIAEQQIKVEPGVPSGFADFATMEAWYTFSDLLIWVRAVEDRVERRGHRGSDQQGLLPAIKPERLKKRVTDLLADFRADTAVGSARKLANFTLHGALVRHPMSGGRLRPDGSLYLPVPDLPQAPVAHWYLLTWSQQRDGIELADGMWAAVQVLVDGVLDAFERATPKRLRA